MLMLVVTIIIAAVVSAYSGGLAANQKKAPTLTADVKIGNGGTWGNSFYRIDVKSVSEPIPTKDIKIVNTWKANGTSASISVTGPNTTAPIQTYSGYSATGNTHVQGSSLTDYQSPIAYGPGVNASVGASSSGPGKNYWPDQQWGNYTLTGGTVVYANPGGAYGGWADVNKRFMYSSPTAYGTSYPYCNTDDRDPMQAILGQYWYYLRTGDTVNVKLIHIPTGKVLLERDVTVQETG
jgi:FlaG/FlaF family flagellin (archaellin)